jgi:pSer/pThr/pTyr-binding forkhead associated (FHA) protein
MKPPPGLDTQMLQMDPSKSTHAAIDNSNEVKTPPGNLINVTPLPRLLIRSHSYENALVLNSKAEWGIGRSKESAIVLPDRMVSRHHAIIKAIAPGLFTLIDLESLNGSFVNEQPVKKPVILQNSDRIKIGTTEMDFQCPTRLPRVNVVQGAKSVLMTHSSTVQGVLWREILSSQGVSATWVDAGVKLTKILKFLNSIDQLPSLLLLDLGMPKSNPYDFCSWCRETYPGIKVILVSRIMRAELFATARHWAIRQGAVDLFPGLPERNLLSCMGDIASKVRIVLNALEWQTIEQSPLASTLLALQQQLKLLSLK